MKSKVRPIEMYFGRAYGGGDYGDWSTDYVEIPIDTPDDKIEMVAKAKAKEEYGGDDLAFVGVYYIMPLEEIDEYYDFCNS